MTLRGRIAAAAGLAVALAVLLVAISLYAATRSELRGELDRSLTRRADMFVGPGPAGTMPPLPPPRAERRRGVQPRFPAEVQPAPLGEPSGYIQFVTPQGGTHVPAGQGPSSTIPLSAADRTIARRRMGRLLNDRTVNGVHLRVLTLSTGGRGAIMIARPLGEIERALHRLLTILAIVGAAGIAVAAALGGLVARAALAPVVRFTGRAETLAGELDLSQRLKVSGRDELARLARSFNATLDALQDSVQAQRSLIADASHELRTPITSLRANIQLLEHRDRLSNEDQAGLREDIVRELDELTSLVGDIVELARGGARTGPREQLHLDEIAREAIQRTARRGGLHFDTSLEPTTILGERDRVTRAVANLLDNARKWSPAGGSVELRLENGVLTVRDHGPGFDPADLPHVFERFYRSSRARKLPGSGLGLAIVQQAAAAHGGYAKASNAVGGGARVEVSFGAPLVAAQS